MQNKKKFTIEPYLTLSEFVDLQIRPPVGIELGFRWHKRYLIPSTEGKFKEKVLLPTNNSFNAYRCILKILLEHHFATFWLTDQAESWRRWNLDYFDYTQVYTFRREHWKSPWFRSWLGGCYQRVCCRTGPGSYYSVPEVESPKGLHDEEVGGEAVLWEVVVGQVQDPTTLYLR